MQKTYFDRRLQQRRFLLGFQKACLGQPSLHIVMNDSDIKDIDILNNLRVAYSKNI